MSKFVSECKQNKLIIMEKKERKPKQKNMPKPATDKLKILCLHGYRQNLPTFKNKLGAFRKLSSKYCDLVFIEAPHKLNIESPDDDPDNIMKSWWFNKDDGTFKGRRIHSKIKEISKILAFSGTNQNGPAFGFEESLKLVEKAWSDDNYQGLLGFSQGACFVGIGLVVGLSDFSRHKIEMITDKQGTGI